MDPASHQQTELWLEGFSSRGFASRNLLWAVDIDGTPDRQYLTAALRRVVRNAPSLRSRFAYREGRLWVEEAEGVPSLAVEEMTGLPRQVLEQRIEAFGMRRFDPSTGSLARFLLARLTEQRSVLLCGFHHLVIDGQSWPVFMEDLASALRGEALPVAATSYAEYCHEQDRVRRDGLSQAELGYWRGIADKPWTRSAFPWDSAPTQEAARTATVRTVIPGDQAAAVLDCADRLGTTPFRLCFAAFAAWLARITGESNQRITTALTGRAEPGLERLVGFCNTTGIVDAEAKADTPFRSLVSSLSEALSTAARHQRLPAGFALNASGAGDAARGLTQGGMAFVKLPKQRQLVAGDLVLSDRRVFLPTDQNEFSVNWQQHSDGIAMTWSFPADSLLKTSAAAFAQQYHHVLSQFVTRPSLCVGEARLLPRNQRADILSKACGPQQAFAIDEPLTQRIAEQVQRSPDRTAVVDGAIRLTYAELGAATDRLAQSLRAHGARRGVIVPLILPSSAALAVAEIAVMKAGAAFATIDPDWPAERRRAVLARLAAPVAVQRDGDQDILAAPDCPVVQVDDAGGPIGEQAGSGATVFDPTPVASEETLYCIFTSGSTGEPKGALNLHRGVANRLFAMSEMFGAGVPPVVLAGAPSTADTHVWQYLWPLTTGGRTIILPRERALSANAVLGICAEESVTHMDFVPSVFRRFTDRVLERPGAETDLESVAWILIGGDRMEPDTVRAFKSCCPEIRIANAYGPTEASIASVFHEMDSEASSGTVIGRPIANTSAVVLDADLNVLPYGVVGEICLGGVAVGRGYLGRPDETARRFVPSPDPSLGARLYRTGDRGRMNRDGTLEFLGRIDDQISLAGNRIEPGEIEASLRSHPSVADAAVALREDGWMGPALVAHILPEANAAPSARILRAYLLKRLPRQLVPTEYRQVTTFPLSKTGKLDRSALALAVHGRKLIERSDPKEPGDDCQTRSIIEVWQTVLGCEGIRRDDDFFLDLGGDSLLALECELLLEERTGRAPDLHRLFSNSTPAELACAVSAGSEAQRDAAVRDIKGILHRQKVFVSAWEGSRQSADSLLFTRNERGTGRPLFWCFQGFHELKGLAEALGPDHPVTGMRSGHMIMDYSPRNVTGLAERYAAEIASMSVPDGLVLGGNCQGAEIMHEVAMILMQRGQKVDMLINLDDTSFKRYPGPVTLIYGQDSRLNPFNDESDPTAFLEQTYPGGRTLAFIQGRHGSYFREPALTDLARIAKGVLQGQTHPAGNWVRAALLHETVEGLVAPFPV